jgi:type 1 fimbria pilin
MYKNLMHLISCLLTLLLFIGCAETAVDNDIRILVKGKVVDQSNTIITDAHIQVYADADAPGADRALLGEGFSDASGNFEVTSLFGPNALFYIVVSADDQFSTYRYQTSTEEFTPNDLTFDLQTVELKKLAVFNYDIIRESGDDNTLDFSFRFIDTSCIEIYNEGILNDIESDCYQVRLWSLSLNNLNPNIENRRITIPFQSQVEFIYSINGEDPVSEIIDINTLDYVFQFSY